MLQQYLIEQFIYVIQKGNPHFLRVPFFNQKQGIKEKIRKDITFFSWLKTSLWASFFVCNLQ